MDIKPSRLQRRPEYAKMSRKCQSLTCCKRLILVLANALVFSTCALVVSLAPLDHVRNPAADTVSILRLGRRPAILKIRRFDVEAGNGGFGRKTRCFTFAASAFAAAAAEQGLRLCSLLWCSGYRCSIAEQRVHIFQADVGGLRVNEVDC